MLTLWVGDEVVCALIAEGITLDRRDKRPKEHLVMYRGAISSINGRLPIYQCFSSHLPRSSVRIITSHKTFFFLLLMGIVGVSIMPLDTHNTSQSVVRVTSGENESLKENAR